MNGLVSMELTTVLFMDLSLFISMSMMTTTASFVVDECNKALYGIDPPAPILIMGLCVVIALRHDPAMNGFLIIWGMFIFMLSGALYIHLVLRIVETCMRTWFVMTFCASAAMGVSIGAIVTGMLVT